MSAAPPLGTAEIGARLAALPGWAVVDGALQRVWRTGGWKATLLLAGAIAHFAEVAWHHPDLILSWDRVTVRLSTHSAGGITALDFALAGKLQEVLSWRPAEETPPLPGTPDTPADSYLRD